MVEVRSLASPELLIAAEAIAVLGTGKSQNQTAGRVIERVADHD